MRAKLERAELCVNGAVGLSDCLRKTLGAEGVVGLYKGLGPSLFSIAPYLGIGEIS